MSEFWISPSSFAWTWVNCKRCWWLSVASRVKQPSSSLPPIVERVDRLSLEALKGADLTAVGVPGVVVAVGERVKAKPIKIGLHSYLVGGQFDILVQLADGTFGVYDVKMTTPNDFTPGKYRLQNAGYALALREPKTGEPVDVTRTGLLIMFPMRMIGPQVALHVADQHTGEVLHETYSADQLDPQEDPEAALLFAFRVLDQATTREAVLADIGELRKVLGEMAKVMDAPTAPKSSEECHYCNYVRKQNELAKRFKESGLEGITEERKPE